MGIQNIEMEVQDYKMLINGEWVESEKRLEVRNPYNQQLLGTVPEATKSHLDEAIDGAVRTFKVTKKMPAHQIAQILENTSDIINNRKEELTRTIALEAGKPVTLARGEVERATETFKLAAELAKQIYGETIPMDASAKGEGRIGFTFREPLGVIGAITPFNFPLNLVAHKVAPAIASGNTVVLKPSTYTPITSIKLGEIMLEAGLPRGALNVVTGPGGTVGDAIVMDSRIAKITFTGSGPVGIEMTKKVGLKRITLELGSNSAVVIDNVGANGRLLLQEIVSRCVFGSFAYAGQVCISIQRIYVHKEIRDIFVREFLEQTKKLKLGDPLDSATDVGPMITEGEAARAKQWVDEAVSEGAKILIGGNHNGTMFEPTVLVIDNAIFCRGEQLFTPTMKVVAQEIFAPVVSIMEFKDWEQVIELVNSSKYGLHAGVYTQDVNKALNAAQKLEVGGVIINDIPTYRADHIPYGGVKESGIGREGVKYAIEEMTQPKFVCFNLS